MKNLTFTAEEIKIIKRALLREEDYCEKHNLNNGLQSAKDLYENVFNQAKEQLTKFEVNSVYQMRYVTDADLKPTYICTKRTNKTATFERYKRPSDKITRKIKVYDDVEYIVEGNYSMAPSIKASNIVA